MKEIALSVKHWEELLTKAKGRLEGQLIYGDYSNISCPLCDRFLLSLDACSPDCPIAKYSGWTDCHCCAEWEYVSHTQHTETDKEERLEAIQGMIDFLKNLEEQYVGVD